MTNKLTAIEFADEVVTFSNPSRDERIAIIAKYNELRRAGHALSITDEVTHAPEVPFIRIFHYRTCYFCLTNTVEGKRGKVHIV